MDVVWYNIDKYVFSPQQIFFPLTLLVYNTVTPCLLCPVLHPPVREPSTDLNMLSWKKSQVLKHTSKSELKDEGRLHERLRREKQLCFGFLSLERVVMDTFLYSFGKSDWYDMEQLTSTKLIKDDSVFRTGTSLNFSLLVILPCLATSRHHLSTLNERPSLLRVLKSLRAFCVHIVLRLSLRSMMRKSDARQKKRPAFLLFKILLKLSLLSLLV